MLDNIFLLVTEHYEKIFILLKTKKKNSLFASSALLNLSLGKMANVQKNSAEF